MIPLTLKPPVVQPIVQQPEPQKLSIDMAEQIADRAARRAAEETVSKTQEISRENMDYNRGQEQNNQQRQVPVEKDSIYEETEGGYSIDTKTEKNLMRRLLDQTLQKALDPPPPNPVEAAVGTVMSRVTEGIAERMLGNIGNTGTGVVAKTGILSEVLNSQFGSQLGANFMPSIAGIIESLTKTVGQKKTEDLVTAATQSLNNQQSPQNNENSNVEKQKDMVLALDSNNPEHIKQYASAMGLTEKAAKGMLQIHQDDIINERKIFSGNNQSNSNNGEITQALTGLIQEMTGMKNVISNLQNEIITLKGGKVPESEVSTEISNIDDKWNEEPTGQSKAVNLFQSPIKVDVDDIKGNNDPFFNDSPKGKDNVNLNKKVTAKPVLEIEESEKNDQKWDDESESVLEETKDAAGNSTFKMSGENEEIVKKQVVNVNKKEVKKEIKEEVVEIDKKETVEDKSSIENKSSVENITEKKSNEKKSNENVPQRRILRKPVPVKTKEEPSSSSTLPNITKNENENKPEKYDINNNLIVD